MRNKMDEWQADSVKRREGGREGRRERERTY